ncbi:MAG TPA: DEAD/DEAH box helicase, partial [Chryseolinea sp.]|nr:DEAD/DEAH box helicase [Chryseolinea sp.]
MLFELESITPKEPTRPTLPKGTVIDYEIGFLFNFASSRSTSFDLEPILIHKRHTSFEYKRISLNAEVALAYLQPLPDDLYNDFLQFSDNKILNWMTGTGNKFIRNANTGSWSHSSVRELKNIRKHYVNLLHKIWPKLMEQPHLFILKSGRFNNYGQENVKLGKQPAEIRFSVEQEQDAIIIKLILLLDGKPSTVNLGRGVLLAKDNVLYLPPDSESLALFEMFANGDLKFPLSLKMEVVKKYILLWMKKYPVDISNKLNIILASQPVESRVWLSELNESNLMIRANFIYDGEVVEYSEEESLVVEQGNLLKIVARDKEGEKKLHEYLRALHTSFSNQRNNSYFYLPFSEVMKKGWFIGMMRKVHEQGYAIHGLADLKKFRYTTHVPKFSIAVTSNADFFDLKVNVQWGDQEVPLKEIRLAILNWQDTIMLEDGTLGHIPEEWIKQYSLLLRTGKEDRGVLKVSKVHFTLLEDILDNLDTNSKQEIETRKRQLLEYDSIEKVPLSSEIKASLRPYQLSGFHWLQALDELSWGGCLADDMGLGKTLQTIS